MQFKPVALFALQRLTVDFPVGCPKDERHPLPSLAFTNHRLDFACFRIESEDVAAGVTDGEVNPTRIVNGDGAGILRPILFVDMPEVFELARFRVVSGDATLRVSCRPNYAIVVFRHAHRHLRDSFADESESAPCRVKLHKVAAEV